MGTTASTSADYVLDLATVRQGRALNRLCGSLAGPAGRERFAADEAACCDEFGLSAAQKRAVLERDWTAMMDLGGSIFYVYKLAQGDGTSMQDLGGAFTGMPGERFAALMCAGGRDLS
jgi:protocatechuate 4,5-dioxygenase alpha chain